MKNYFLAILIFTVAFCNAQNKITNQKNDWPMNVQIPDCEKRPKTMIQHGDTRVDDYYWLNGFFL